MGKVTLGKAVEDIKTEVQEVEENQKEVVVKTEIKKPNQIPIKNDFQNGIDLNVDETKFVLAKLAQMQYTGVEIEFIYHLLQKLQNHLQSLLNK